MFDSQSPVLREKVRQSIRDRTADHSIPPTNDAELEAKVTRTIEGLSRTAEATRDVLTALQPGVVALGRALAALGEVFSHSADAVPLLPGESGKKLTDSLRAAACDPTADDDQ